MGSTRIKGRQLALKFGTPPVDYWADTISVELDNEEADSDTVTFEDAASGGGRQFFFNVTAIQSTDPESFRSNVWDHTGQTRPFTNAPHRNATPTPEQPHFVGQVKVGPRPKIGGEAGSSAYQFETRWDCEGTVKDIGA
jgi:hypothetical protein